MHEVTTQFLTRLWAGSPRFAEVDVRLRYECSIMSPVVAALIGRDVLLRHDPLDTPLFRMAAFLASDGIAGNDRLIDFTDCVVCLPEPRYHRIVDDPDNLLDDDVSSDFGEYGFRSAIESVFEAPFGEEGDGLLAALVFGSLPKIHPVDFTEAEVDVPTLLPRLNAKHGHLLRRKERSIFPIEKFGSVVTLEDLIGKNPT